MMEGAGILQKVPWSLVNILRPFFTPGVRCIDEQVLTAPGTFTFTGLNQSYRDLFLTCQLRSDDANGVESDTAIIWFNNDTGANQYTWMRKQAQASNVFVAAGATGDTHIQIARIEAANARANCFTPFMIRIQGYRFTDREKFAYCSNSGAFGDRSALADMFITDYRGAWKSQNAVNRIDLAPLNGTNFVAGSRVTVYGLL